MIMSTTCDVNTVAVEAVDCPEFGGDELVSGITMTSMSQSLQDKDANSLDSYNSAKLNGMSAHQEADDHAAAAGTQEDSTDAVAVNIVAVEAVDCPGDELVSGITMSKNMHHLLQDLPAHPV